VRVYTSFTQERGNLAAARLTERFAALSHEVVSAHGGEVEGWRAAECLAVFESTKEALRAALELRDRCEKETDSEPSLPLRVGIGLDAGEPIWAEGVGYIGRAVLLAKRLCSSAGPGEILVSEACVENVGNVD
jgi:class 3 adenylate cyclase